MRQKGRRYVSAAEAAILTGRGDRALRRALWAGEIPGAFQMSGKRGGRWSVPVDALGVPPQPHRPSRGVGGCACYWLHGRKGFRLVDIAYCAGMGASTLRERMVAFAASRGLPTNPRALESWPRWLCQDGRAEAIGMGLMTPEGALTRTRATSGAAEIDRRRWQLAYWLRGWLGWSYPRISSALKRSSRTLRRHLVRWARDASLPIDPLVYDGWADDLVWDDVAEYARTLGIDEDA